MHVLDEVEEVDLLARVCLEQPCLGILLGGGESEEGGAWAFYT